MIERYAGGDPPPYQRPLLGKGRGKNDAIASGDAPRSETSDVPWSSTASGGWEESMSERSEEWTRDTRSYVTQRDERRRNEWRQPTGWQERARRDWFAYGNMGSGSGNPYVEDSSSQWDDISSPGWAAPGAWRQRSQL